MNNKTEYQLEYEVIEPKINLSTTTKPQIWLAFHGIGQNTEAFNHFAIQNNFKVYSFGLFYHEKNRNIAEKNRETPLQDWVLLMNNFLEKENLNLKGNSIHVIGFSLGVRPALQFVYNFSCSDFVLINQIILIAPETLAVSNWYRLGTQTGLGKFLLKKLSSSTFFKELIIRSSGLFFSKKAIKLIRYQVYHNINSLAHAWLAYRPFEVSGKKWRKIYQKHNEKITIVASENDNFVALKKIQNFIKKNSDEEGKSIKWIISKSSHARLLREFRL